MMWMVQIGGQGVEPVHQVFAPLPKEALVIAPAQDDFSHAAGPGVLGDLEGGVVAVHRGDAGPQLLRQAQVGPQAAAVVVAHVLEVGGLHEQGGEAAAEGLRHAGRRADDIGVGRRAGKADQDVLAALGLGAHPGVRRRLSRSAVRRRAISRRAARFFRVKKWSMARAAWLGR